MANDDNTILLGTRVETREALEGIERFTKEAGEELRSLAEGGDGDARKLLLDTEEAEASLRRVIREFEETGRSSEEGLRRAEEALRRVSGAMGLEKDLRLVPPELEAISKASGAAGAAVEKFQRQAEAGGKGAERAAVLADVAVERLASEIERVRASGGPVPPEWEKRLSSYREGLNRGYESVGRFAASQKKIQDELAVSREKFASLEDQARTLPEAIIRRWPAAEGAIVSFGSALATLQISYRQTREFVGWVKEHFGVDIDAAMQEGIVSIVEHARTREAWLKAEQEALNFERNAANVTSKLRKEVRADQVRDSRALLAEFEKIQQELHQIDESGARGLKDLAEGLAGIKTEDLEARLSRTIAIVDSFDGDFSKLAASPAFPALAEEVRKLAEILDTQGAALRANLSGEELRNFEAAVETFQRDIRQNLEGTFQFLVQGTRELLDAFGVQTPEAIAKSAAALEDLISVYGGLGKVTQEQASQVAAEADRILKAIALLPPGQRAAMAEITAALHATSDAYRQHAEMVAAFSASATKSVQEAVAARVKAYEEEKKALADLAASAAESRDELLKSLRKPEERPAQDRNGAREELADLKLKPIQSEEDIERIKELEKQLGGLRQKQESARAGSEEVADAVSKMRGELQATTATLTELEVKGIDVLLSRLQQTADESGATASQISEAFAGVDTIVSQASQRAASLNDSAAAAFETAKQAAGAAKVMGEGSQNIVASVDEAGKVLISNLADVGDGAKVVKATLDDASTAGAEWSKATKESGAAVDGLILGVDGLAAGMETVSTQTARAQETLQGIGDTSERAGDAFRAIGEHALTAAEPVRKIADGLQAAASSVEPLHSSAQSLAQMREDAPRLADDLSRLEPADRIQARAAARKEEAAQLLACAVAAERLARALDPKKIEEEGHALNKLADALARVAEGLEAERTAREGEGAPN